MTHACRSACGRDEGRKGRTRPGACGAAGVCRRDVMCVDVRVFILGAACLYALLWWNVATLRRVQRDVRQQLEAFQRIIGTDGVQEKGGDVAR